MSLQNPNGTNAFILDIKDSLFSENKMKKQFSKIKEIKNNLMSDILEFFVITLISLLK